METALIISQTFFYSAASLALIILIAGMVIVFRRLTFTMAEARKLLKRFSAWPIISYFLKKK